jgi:spermidine synthase
MLSVAVFTQRRSSMRFAAGVAGVLVAAALFADAAQPVLHAERTFFGVHRVVQDKKHEYRGLAHGTTLHGMQSLNPARRREPLTYFHRTGPFGQAFDTLPALKSAHDVAVIGLGAGTLAAYARPSQNWTFYEIDPAVERIARTRDYFSYLSDCGAACRVVLGDARLSLQHARDTYDLFVLDAFSSDAIPMHLMTTEALALYLSHLNPQGVLMFHISNQHLLLGPVVARLAASQNLVALEQVDLMAEHPQPVGKSPSHWVVMSRSAANLRPLVNDSRWHTPHAAAGTPLWTDDFSNILSALRLR